MPNKLITPKELLGWLSNAKGRAELIIACVIDIRGFSSFSKSHESPELAMYLKGFYTQAIQRFFPTANFAKPTGDGLLLTFTFQPESLAEVSIAVFKGCFELLEAFPLICQGDPMVNFDTPRKLGIGISRGPACCLHSGRRIIDYSGHFLNLAARLMDLARPHGIVVDGNFLEAVIPQEAFRRFKSANVFLRGISEDTAHPIFYLEGSTVLSDSCLHPLTEEKWEVVIGTYTVGQIRKLLDRHEIILPCAIKSPSSLRVTFYHPDKSAPNARRFQGMQKIKYLEDGDRPRVALSMDEVRQFIMESRLAGTKEITCEVTYIPK